MAVTEWEAIIARARRIDHALRQGKTPDEHEIRALVGELLAFQDRISTAARPILEKVPPAKP